MMEEEKRMARPSSSIDDSKFESRSMQSEFIKPLNKDTHDQEVEYEIRGLQIKKKIKNVRK